MVNINDINLSKDETETDKDRLHLIFNEQKRLMEKYHAIEESNGAIVVHEYPFNLDSRKGQIRLKDMAWRIVEELTEATQALSIHPDIPEHHQEELMDALHFQVELMIVSGIDPSMVLTLKESMDLADPVYREHFDKLEFLYCIHFPSIYSVGDRYETAYSAQKVTPIIMKYGAYDVIQHLGNAMNCLKNKPWKTTHMTTDVNKYNHSVINAFRALIHLIGDCGLSPQNCYEMYLKKNRVNQFRQRSNY